MKNEFLKLAQDINNSQNQEELEKIIKNWKIEDEDIDSWTDELFDSINEIDINRIPYVLHSLYKENDKVKFMYFCILLENTHLELPFITNLEDLPIFKSKYKILIPTLIKVTKNSYNEIADCMYSILLNKDPKGLLLKKEEKEEFISSLNDKLNQIAFYLKDCKEEELDESVYSVLELLLEVAININNEETLKILQKLEDMNIIKNNKLNLEETYLKK